MRPFSVAFIVALLLFSLLPALVPPALVPSTLHATSASPASPPNVILILTDDLESYPETLATMPNLQQRLVQEGMSFSNAVVTMPSCCPSRTSVLTGRYVHNHGVTANKAPFGGYERFMENNLEATTVATVMQAAGYHTALLGKYINHYPLTTDPNHVPPGWTEWYGYVHGGLFRRYVLNENGTWVKYTGKPEEYSTDLFSAKAVDFIKRHGATEDIQPFFLLLTPFAPHYPAHAAPRHADLFADAQAPRHAAYNEIDTADKPNWVQKLDPLTQEQAQFIDALYRDRLRSMQAVDEMIGALYDTLRDTGQLDNTYIIFTSDNGLHLGEHRIVYGKGTAYDAAIRVPFVVRGPGVPANSAQTAIISLVDLAPTFGEIAGVTALPASFDGRSLFPLFTNQLGPEEWRTAVLFDNPDNHGIDDDHGAAQEQDVQRASQAANTWLPEEFAELLYDEAYGDVYFDDEHTVVIGKDGVPVIVEGTEGEMGGKPETTGGMASVGFRTATYKYVEYKNGDRELYDLIADPLELDNQAVNAPPTLLTLLSVHLDALRNCAGESCRAVDLRVPRSVFPLTDDGVTPTGISTEIATATATPEPSPTVTGTRTGNPTPTHTLAPTLTPALVPTSTPTIIPTLAPTATPSATPIPVEGGGSEPFHLYLPRIG